MFLFLQEQNITLFMCIVALNTDPQNKIAVINYFTADVKMKTKKISTSAFIMIERSYIYLS